MRSRPSTAFRSLFMQTGLLAVLVTQLPADEPTAILWPGKPPGPEINLGPEVDTTRDGDNLVAGRRVIRLGNVTTPMFTVYRADRSGIQPAILICPGGGHHILAWDLEGTEVAQWCNRLGVTGIVLKYRVPFRDPKQRWKAAVQDAQRAMSVIRARADEWQIDANRVGILGFSAGGETAAMTCLLRERQYEPVDEIDQQAFRPDLAVLVYPARLVDPNGGKLRADAHVDNNTTPMFMAHAFDDGVSVENSLLLYLALKRAGVPSELHAYSTGGHGFGLRTTENPCTRWPEACADWLRTRGWLDTPSTGTR